jgi:hypothetical protein
VIHPLERWPVRHRRPWLLALLVLWAVVEIPLLAMHGPLTTDAAPNGIVSHELAGDTTTAERIADSWKVAGATDEAGFSLGIDFLAMPIYSTVFAGLAVAAVSAARRRRWTRIAVAGVLIAWGQWVAAAFDVVETGSEVRMLDDPSAAGWPAVARACALTKFSLLGLGLLFVLVVGVAAMMTRVDQES